MDGDVHEVWAVADYGGESDRRWLGGCEPAIHEGIRIARQSGEEGAISVWVVGPDGIVWAAGMKARELKDNGAELDAWGRVLPAALHGIQPRSDESRKGPS